MPVTVTLFRLVQVPNTESMWPEEFRAFEKTLSKKPVDLTGFGACADWLDTNDEPELARAYRFVMSKHIYPNYERKWIDEDSRRDAREWRLGALVPSGVLRQVGLGKDANKSTLAALMADLYARIVQAEAEVAKMKEELA